jgi:subtilisin
MTSSSEDRQDYLVRSRQPRLPPDVLRSIEADPSMAIARRIGAAGEPHTLLVSMSELQAATLAQRYASELIVEPDRPLTSFASTPRPTQQDHKADGDHVMAQKSELDTADNPRSTAPGKAPPGTAAGTQARKGVHIASQARRRYLVAMRRAVGVSPFATPSLTIDDVERALRASPDVEIVDRLGPKALLGAMADGMPHTPHVLVAHMEDRKAEVVHQQGQGHLIVERDQPLNLHDAPFSPPVVTASISGAPPIPIQILVLGDDDAPVEGAEVYLYGSLLPTMGVTNSAGQVTLGLVGDTLQSIRGIQVRPKGDYWSFYQSQPLLDASQPNIVTLKSLSETFQNFPTQQVMGWGQKAMRLDFVPPQLRGQGVKIAIVDSGAATSHEDLRDIAKGVDIVGKANNNNANSWMVDTLSHGSHCAGVISGHSASKIGIVGFAPAAEIHVCKIFPGGQVSALVDALEYCIEQQIDIVNLSLGMDQISEVLEQQLIRAVNLGIACVVAAGNSGGPVQYPAASPNVLAVAAVGRMGEFPPDSSHAQTVQGVGPDGFFSPRFTCFGPEIALCAPGVAIVSSVPPNSFAAWDGTSMAAPHVTGLGALVLAHHPDFSGTFKARNAQRVARLFQILKASARPVNLGDPRRTGFGIPDAPTALGLHLTTQVPQPQPSTQFNAAANPANQPFTVTVQAAPGSVPVGPAPWANVSPQLAAATGSHGPWGMRQPGYWTW